MRLIAHRGNISGPNPELENAPDQIQYCISSGYDVEIDLWLLDDNSLWLGHDSPTYCIDWNFLVRYKQYIWIHCKNLNALHELSTNRLGYNFFVHQDDDFTITSHRYIWTYPKPELLTLGIKSNQIILDFSVNPDLTKYTGAYGVCCDYFQTNEF